MDSLDPNPPQLPQQAVSSAAARQQHQLRLQARQVQVFSAAHWAAEHNLRLETPEAESLAEQLLQSLQLAACLEAVRLRQTSPRRPRAEVDYSAAEHPQQRMQAAESSVRLPLSPRNQRPEERVCSAEETTMLATTMPARVYSEVSDKMPTTTTIRTKIRIKTSKHWHPKLPRPTQHTSISCLSVVGKDRRRSALHLLANFRLLSLD